MATLRKGIPKKTRFEVFKRDSFKCQYCGASAPEVVLEVDHIDPVSKGGADELVNYVTACRACNAGKSDRRLSDNTTLAKQKAQLDELNERREQLEMMLQWRQGLKDIEESAGDAAYDAWRQSNPGYTLKDSLRSRLSKIVREFGLATVLDAIETAADRYHRLDAEGRLTQESVDEAWQKLGGVARMKSMPADERQLHYIKGILRARLNYVPVDVATTLAVAARCGVAVDDIQQEAKECRNWSEFNRWLMDRSERASGKS